MAGKTGKKKDKDAASAESGGSGKLFVLLQNVFAVLAALCALFLFLGAFNVGPTALLDAIHGFAVVPAILFALFLAGAVLTNGAIRKGEQASIEKKLAELEAKLEVRVTGAVAKVDSHIGDDYQALRAENQTMREKLEAMQLAEKTRMAEEVEKLRSVNVELEEQIKRWAIGSVDHAMTDQGVETVKVA